MTSDRPAAPPTPASTQTPVRTNWPLIVAVGIAVFMSTVDMTIVQTALPSMQESFDVSPRLAQWLIFAYAGAMIALQLPAGRWIDSVSARGAFTWSVAGFTAASVLAAAAPTGGFLLAARALQGAFGAVIGALSLALVIAAAPPASRGRAMGVVGMLGPLGAVSGPVIGAALLSVWDWRAIFLVNVPVGGAALVLGWRHIAGSGRLALPGFGFLRESLAAVLAGTALFVMLTAAAEPTPTWALLVLALAVFIAAGAWWSRQPGGQALVSLLRHPPLALIMAATLAVTTVGGSLLYLPPFTLDRVVGLPVAQWGLVLLCLSLGLATASNIAGVLTDRWGAWPTGVAGAAITLAGAVWLAIDPTAGGAAGLAARLFLTGLGLGTFHVPMQTIYMSAVPAQSRGTASAATNVTRQIGFSVGPALCTIVWFTIGAGRADGVLAAYWVPALTASTALLIAIYLMVRYGRRRGATG